MAEQAVLAGGGSVDKGEGARMSSFVGAIAIAVRAILCRWSAPVFEWHAQFRRSNRAPPVSCLPPPLFNDTGPRQDHAGA